MSANAPRLGDILASSIYSTARILLSVNEEDLAPLAHATRSCSQSRSLARALARQWAFHLRFSLAQGLSSNSFLLSFLSGVGPSSGASFFFVRIAIPGA